MSFLFHGGKKAAGAVPALAEMETDYRIHKPNTKQSFGKDSSGRAIVLKTEYAYNPICYRVYLLTQNQKL